MPPAAGKQSIANESAGERSARISDTRRAGFVSISMMELSANGEATELKGQTMCVKDTRADFMHIFSFKECDAE